ncbi:MAG: hypothetical protein M1836_007142 [Candelina mexicana]|nr:MAG: hypothetical protein M1836_007142 [Candelina mexicana]
MALLSGFTLIRSLSLFHLTLAFFLLKAPHKIADQNLVFILGEAMRLPHPQSFQSKTAPTALLSVVLTLLGISDLVAVSLPEEVASYYWGSQTPLRLFFFFILTGYTYTFKPGGAGAQRGRSLAPDAAEGLNNSIVFTLGFIEMVSWFWIYVTLRDERRQAATRFMQKKKAEEAMM